MKFNKETTLKVAKAIWTHGRGKIGVTAIATFLLGTAGLQIAPEVFHAFVEVALVVLAVL